MSSEQKPSEKGNVARMVDRLSKDLGAGTGILTKTENVPLRNRVVTNNAVVGGVGAADSQQILGCIIPSTTAFDTAVVRYSYTALQKDELDLKEGDELLVLESVEDGWARGEILHSSGHPARKGLVGLYPTNFVSTISSTQTTQTGPSYNSAGSTATFPRAIGTTNAKEHQQENNNGNRSPEVADGISPLSKSAPKSSSNFMISNSGGSESDGGTECGQSAIGVVRTGNVLPSTLLKTGNINAGGMVANNSGGGGNTRRAVSTLIGGTSGGNNSFGIGMNSPASATAKTAAAAQQQQQHTPPHHQPPLHAKAKEFAKVLYKYEAAAADELSLPEGAIVTVATRQCEDDGWFVAELPDGRCGLFPDNFVNFYPAELTGSGIHLHQQQTSPNNHSYPAPPSLPAKPQKFVQPQLQQQQLNSPTSVPPPIASARDSLSALVVNVMSSSSANDSNNPGNPLTRSMELTESKKGIATSDNKMENISGTTTTNNNAGNSAHKNKVFDTTGTDGTAAARPTAPTSTATTAEGSNRHSRIVAIQDILKQQLPPGRLPMQRPPSLGAKPADNVEPKMPGMESPVSEAQQQQKQQQDAFVKSRTKIAPTNKRPPSKVNSAAVVASESANNNTSTSTPWIQKSFPSSPLSSPTTPNKPQQQLPPLSLDTKILQDIHQPTSTTVSATTSKSTVFPSQSGGPPSPSAPHQSVQTLLCTLGEEQKQPEVQLLKASPHFQPPIVPPASSSSHFKDAHSPSNSSVASAATDITMGSSSVFPLPPSSSASTSVQWVSRADFDRFAEECQRKFADMQAEIRELRQRVETAHNK